LFQTFNVQENVGTLHCIIEESKERRKWNIETKDKWRELEQLLLHGLYQNLRRNFFGCERCYPR
ncbi:hypothetical protein DFS33DRAFT_1256849, partial [Desarmillaria ectypa]